MDNEKGNNDRWKETMADVPQLQTKPNSSHTWDAHLSRGVIGIQGLSHKKPQSHYVIGLGETWSQKARDLRDCTFKQPREEHEGVL